MSEQVFYLIHRAVDVGVKKISSAGIHRQPFLAAAEANIHNFFIELMSRKVLVRHHHRGGTLLIENTLEILISQEKITAYCL